MATLVRFRFNKATGEVEEFLVDDQDRHLPEAEHDRIATDVGRFVAAYPRVIEVSARAAAGQTSRVAAPDEREAEGVGGSTEGPEVE